MNLRDMLSQAVTDAMRRAGVPDGTPALVTQSTRPEFGDYQANGAMAAAKQMKTNPRELAGHIVEQLALDGIAIRTDIAGPGFINIHLDPLWLAQRAALLASDPQLGVPQRQPQQTVVVDYSAPNLAKEMHVGHLRSTIIGDAVVKALEFEGAKVIRQNHVGDWGTQFGMLIAHLEDTVSSEQASLADLEAFYRAAKQRFDEDPSFAARARDYVVRLQSGDAHCRTLWQRFIDISVSHSDEIYQKLNVSLTRNDIRAESAYNDDLPVVIAELRAKGLLQESDGANVVFLDELKDREGLPQAVIVQKSDGGYLYATTDLAAARYRQQQLHADRVLYFIDDRQKLHMQQVFAISRKAGFASDAISLEHHPFGKMLGEDGKPFKTRSGGTVKLAELLDEAVERAGQLMAERDTDLNEAERQEVARKVGIGAVKYADLSKNRTSDYIFNWDQMLSFEGNTAPYMQYAYTRVRSIFRRAGIEQITGDATVSITAPEERALVLQLLRFPEAVEQVTRDAYPHMLCGYLYELAGLYMRFYEQCPVLKEGIDEATRQSRLLLCHLCAAVLQRGLNVLGIDTLERM